MKKLLSLSLASLAFAAVADITVGVTEVSATGENTIIPVPYTTIGSTSPVSVHDLVKAANLKDGTLLYYYNGSSYQVWLKNESVWTTPDVSTTPAIAGTSVAQGSSDVSVSVGAALWVCMPGFASASADEKKVFVYGSPVATKTSTIVKNKTNLLSNPTEATVSGDTLAGKLKPDVKDVIMPIGAEFDGTYVYGGSENGWVHITPGNSPVKNATLPSIGSYQGFWYVSKTAGDNVTINW